VISELHLPRVRTFLDSVGRNSIKTRKAYELELKMLHWFLIQSSYSNYNIESIIEALQEGKVNPYELIDGFVSYLVSVRQVNNAPLAPTSIALRVYAIRSYLQYYDIDINPSKFRRRVRLPKLAREDEQAIDASDIRKILLACNNRRLKAYLLVLASGGMRALEALAIRNKDLDFTVRPTKIHIRKEYTKTKVGRNIYISDEATAFLKQWLDWKYRPERESSAESTMAPATLPSDDLVFSQLGASDPNRSYQKLVVEYHKLLDVVGLGERKDNSRRRKVTLHSLRRFAKSVIADATNQDFSEFFLGHKKSPYYVRKEQELRELYRTRCMKQLTFLDYTSIEATTKEVETRLREKDMEIERLRNLDALSRDVIRELSDRLMRLEAKFNGS
jgi:integrase